jgi:hypothetical protein
VRILNGNLLVRTGGGYQDLLDALGKLPAPSAFSQSGSTAAARGDAGSGHGSSSMLAAAVAGMSPTPSPRTPGVIPPSYHSHNAHNAHRKLSVSDTDSHMGKLASSSGSGLGYSRQQLLHSGPIALSGAPAGALGAHQRLDLNALPCNIFSSSSMTSPLLPSARGRDAGVASTPAAAADGTRLHSGSSAAAFEAAVQAALAAAVEAAAHAGLDDGMGTSGGGASPGPGRPMGQHSRAALLGRVIAAKTAAGTLIEAGMCPPVPVQEEVGTPSVSAPASMSGAARF